MLQTTISFSPLLLLSLFFMAILAGWVDSIGGGGGLISMQALTLAGLNPLQAVATNKLQASFGSSTATYTYYQQGLVDIKAQRLAVLMAFIGSMSGTLLVQTIKISLLQKIIPILLILLSVYLLFSPKLKDKDQPALISTKAFVLSVALGVGFYDGFFGPGAGMFYTIGFVTLLGYGLPKATGNTKLLNFTSNIASLLFFALSGQIVWLIGLVMGLGQIIGGYLGAKMASKHGVKLIRPILISMSLLVSIKLLFS